MQRSVARLVVRVGHRNPVTCPMAVAEEAGSPEMAGTARRAAGVVTASPVPLAATLLPTDEQEEKAARTLTTMEMAVLAVAVVASRVALEQEARPVAR